VIGLAPAANWLPWTVKTAVSLPPEADKAAVPRAVWPTVKVTVPDTAVVPDAAVTAAFKIVEPPALRVVGVAANERVVEMSWLRPQATTKL